MLNFRKTTANNAGSKSRGNWLSKAPMPQVSCLSSAMLLLLLLKNPLRRTHSEPWAWPYVYHLSALFLMHLTPHFIAMLVSQMRKSLNFAKALCHILAYMWKQETMSQRCVQQSTWGRTLIRWHELRIWVFVQWKIKPLARGRWYNKVITGEWKFLVHSLPISFLSLSSLY